MALNIKNPVTERLAQEVARATGTSLTEAVTVALEERLATLRRREASTARKIDISDLQALVRAAPVRDSRSEDELLGYDEFGLPS
ncbi:MAG TPA: type II toxin-antitoxin system VapB family antitoxin [Gemmatimonadales bacterium]